MKFEKAKVTIINLGDQDILTCSGDDFNKKSCYFYNPYSYTKTYTKTKTTKKSSFGWGWGWFGGWWF